MNPVRASFAWSWLAAAAAHALAFAWLATRPPAPLPAVRRPPTQVRLVTRTPLPPPAPPKRVEPSPPPPPARTAERRVARAEPLPPEQRTAQPPRPDAPPPPSSAPPPRRFAVSMDATVQGGGGVAVPVTPGRTAARGDPTLPSSAPVGDNPAIVADATEVEQPPRLVSQPSSDDLKALYPEQARRQGVEGNVRVELLVNDRGTVERIRIVQRGGFGFDEVAESLAPRFRFRPAERGGRAVAVWIPWTLKFRLDG